MEYGPSSPLSPRSIGDVIKFLEEQRKHFIKATGGSGEDDTPWGNEPSFSQILEALRRGDATLAVGYFDKRIQSQERTLSAPTTSQETRDLLERSLNGLRALRNVFD